MQFVIDLSRGSVVLEGPGEFDRFSVRVIGPGAEEGLAEELAALVGEAGLGRVCPDGDHVAVDPAAVRRLAGAAATADWEAGFEGMCAYAAGKGWVEDDGAILAHVECGS